MNLNDREILARTLQAEAGNQGFVGMIAAGSVIMNRVGAGFGSNVRDVIMAPAQFSAWNSVTGAAGGEQGQNMDFTPSSEAYKAADALLSGQYEDITGGATHYYNPDISQPDWGMAAGGAWKRIGDHVFGKAGPGKRTQRGTQTMDRQQPTAQQMQQMQQQPTAQQMQQMQQQPTAQQMQQQPQQGGLMGFLRDPRTRQVLSSFSNTRYGQRLGDIASADLARQQEQEAMAAEEAKAQQQRAAAMQQQQQITNRTLQVLAQRAEGGDQVAAQVLAAIQSGAMDPKSGMKLYLEKSTEAPKATFTTLTGAQLNEQLGLNLDPEKLYNRSSDGKITAVGSGGTNVTVGAGEKKYEQSMGEYWADTEKEILTSAKDARKTLNTVGIQRQLMNSPSFKSGQGQEYFDTASKLLSRFGIGDADVANNEAFKALASQSVLDQLGGSLGAGVSNADVGFLQNTVATLNNTPSGIKLLLDIKEALAGRELQIEKLARQWKKETNSATLSGDWSSYLDDWAQNNPIFVDANDLF